MARSTGFVERKSPIGGFNFLITFTNGQLNAPESTLAQLAAFMGSLGGSTVTPQALDERINDLGAKFLKACLDKAMRLASQPAVIARNQLRFLDHVYIIDSTNFDLDNQLQNVFKGCHGAASKSSMRIQFAYDYLSGKSYVELGDVTLGDAKTLNEIIAENKLDTSGACLFLGDLGYFKTDTFVRINHNPGNFYLSKFKYQTKVTDLSGRELDLTGILKNGAPEFSLAIKIGDLKCRLVGQKLPESILQEKLRRNAENCRRKGRTGSQEYKIFLSYSLFITNLPDDFCFNSLYQLYRLRWQIELVFKTWKSILKIHCLRSGKEARVRCQVYGKLIVATLFRIIYLNAQALSECQLSFHRALQCIKSLAVAWAWSLFQSRIDHKTFLSRLIAQLHRTCKKRGRGKRNPIETLLENINLYVKRNG